MPYFAITIMSPTKRSYDELPLNEGSPLVKRIRGGGPEDFPEEELFDEEFMEMDAVEQDIPDDIEDADDDVVSSSKSQWVRPSLSSSASNKNDLNVQWLDIDMVSGKPLQQNPNPLLMANLADVQERLGNATLAIEMRQQLAMATQQVAPRSPESRIVWVQPEAFKYLGAVPTASEVTAVQRMSAKLPPQPEVTPPPANPTPQTANKPNLTGYF